MLSLDNWLIEEIKKKYEIYEEIRCHLRVVLCIYDVTYGYWYWSPSYLYKFFTYKIIREKILTLTYSFIKLESEVILWIFLYNQNKGEVLILLSFHAKILLQNFLILILRSPSQSGLTPYNEYIIVEITEISSLLIFTMQKLKFK